MPNEPILLIDDDTDDQEIIRHSLLQLNIPHPIHCFENGAEALEYLKTTEEQPFLILCDINMPLMNGIELKRAIFNNDILHRKSIPFVFLTTTATMHVVEEAYEMSVQGFFEKEANLADIQQLVRQIYDYWNACRHPKNSKQRLRN